jgi:hypothetical protein
VAKLFEMGNVPDWLADEDQIDAEAEIVKLCKAAQPEARA